MWEEYACIHVRVSMIALMYACTHQKGLILRIHMYGHHRTYVYVCKRVGRIHTHIGMIALVYTCTSKQDCLHVYINVWHDSTYSYIHKQHDCAYVYQHVWAWSRLCVYAHVGMIVLTSACTIGVHLHYNMISA